MPWAKLCALVEPHYPKPGNGRRPKELEQMLRMYFLQQWFNLADPAVEEALYDSATLRQFARIDLGAEPVPDETTVCKFRHLLEEPDLGEKILGTVNLHLQETRVWGNGAYQGRTEVIRECAPRARDFTQRRCRYKGQIVDEVAWAKNRTKSKVRYRGLKKNTHRLFVTCALVNLFVSRRKLLMAV